MNNANSAKPAWRVALLAMMLLTGFSGRACATEGHVTMEIAGTLLAHGGVVIVYPIPVSAKDWAGGMAANPRTTVRLDTRFTVIQLRYPADGTYAYRFSLTEARPNADSRFTQVLSIIGTDEKNHGPQMVAGFTGAYSSGGRIIRVLPADEYAGQDQATRTNARWGKIEGRDTPPPADERSARALEVIIDEDMQRSALECSGGENVQVCVVSAGLWPKLESVWWRAIAESRLERLHHHALRRCYDSSWTGGGTCDPDPSSNEPQFLKRK